MKKTKVRASSDTSWLDAARQLILNAQLMEKNLRSLTIKEDRKGEGGKFRLKTRLSL